MKKVYNKLVRDRIPEIIEAAGKNADVRTAEESEYKDLLQQKLLEEVDEFLESGNPEELADILEVVISLGSLYDLSCAELMKMAEEKREKRGGFKERIVLLSVDD